MTTQVFLARQPIYDNMLRTVAYEILFRTNRNENHFNRPSSDTISAELMLNAQTLGIPNLSNGKTFFINGDRSLIEGEIPIIFEADRVVIEVLEDLEPDDSLLAGCARLRSKGFRLALDDVVEVDDRLKALLPFASYVKVDIRQVGEDQIGPLIEFLKGFPVVLLAEKVETWAEIEKCHDLGFSLFQGYALSRPQLLEGKTISPSALSATTLMSRLSAEDVSISEISDMVMADPPMSYRLLKIAADGTNHGMAREIRSITEAISIIGLRRLKTWAILLSLSDSAEIPREQFTNALMRARLCENLALLRGLSVGQEAYTTGLVSYLDVLMGLSREKIVGELPLDDEVASAIEFYRGELGEILKVAETIEAGELDGLSLEAGSSNVKDLNDAYLEAVSFADRLIENLLDEDQPTKSAT
ncbi:MAG: HDOD domain-containing protein [Actinomycetota bacterium]|nr:HDOD domain-containing protein [Actinomycetota bacterium]